MQTFPNLTVGYLYWNGSAFVFTPSTGGGGPPTGPAGGALSGTYPNPTIDLSSNSSITGQLPVANLLPVGSNGYSLQIIAGVPTWAFPTPIGTAGGDLSNSYPNPTVISSQGHTIITNVSSAGGDLSGTYPNPEVTGLLGNALPSVVDGYLAWNGTNFVWSPGTSGGGGSFVVGGDLAGFSGSQEVIGLLNKALPSLPVSDSYLNYTGSAWQFSVLPTSLPPNGAAGGDLSGTYPNPVVSKIHTVSVSATAPTNGQILALESGVWTPVTPAPTFIASHDLSGSNTEQTVIGIQGQPVSATAPTSGQVLEWIGSAWTPTALPAALPPNGTAGGDLSGTYPNPVISKLQSVPIILSGLTSGQILEYNGVDWINATPSSGSFTAGGDLTGTNTHQFVQSISGASGSGGTVTITSNNLEFLQASTIQTIGGAALSISGSSALNLQITNTTVVTVSASAVQIAQPVGGISGNTFTFASNSISLTPYIGTTVIFTSSQIWNRVVLFSGSIPNIGTTIIGLPGASDYILDFTNCTFDHTYPGTGAIQCGSAIIQNPNCYYYYKGKTILFT